MQNASRLIHFKVEHLEMQEARESETAQLGKSETEICVHKRSQGRQHPREKLRFLFFFFFSYSVELQQQRNKCVLKYLGDLLNVVAARCWMRITASH